MSLPYNLPELAEFEQIHEDYRHNDKAIGVAGWLGAAAFVTGAVVAHGFEGIDATVAWYGGLAVNGGALGMLTFAIGTPINYALYRGRRKAWLTADTVAEPEMDT